MGPHRTRRLPGVTRLMPSGADSGEIGGPEAEVRNVATTSVGRQTSAKSPCNHWGPRHCCRPCSLTTTVVATASYFSGGYCCMQGQVLRQRIRANGGNWIPWRISSALPGRRSAGAPITNASAKPVVLRHPRFERHCRRAGSPPYRGRGARAVQLHRRPGVPGNFHPVRGRDRAQEH